MYYVVLIWQCTAWFTQVYRGGGMLTFEILPRVYGVTIDNMKPVFRQIIFQSVGKSELIMVQDITKVTSLFPLGTISNVHIKYYGNWSNCCSDISNWIKELDRVVPLTWLNNSKCLNIHQVILEATLMGLSQSILVFSWNLNVSQKKHCLSDTCNLLHQQLNDFYWWT